jgi:hypothetical protein
MKVIGLNGKTYPWNPVGKASQISRENISSHHLRARALLKNIYRTERILEEVALTGTSPVLFADFLVPLYNLIIEVHGIQHYEHVPLFHPTKRDFLQAKRRDEIKRSWCELNNFTYIELPYWEGDLEWKKRILG